MRFSEWDLFLSTASRGVFRNKEDDPPSLKLRRTGFVEVRIKHIMIKHIMLLLASKVSECSSKMNLSKTPSEWLSRYIPRSARNYSTT